MLATCEMRNAEITELLIDAGADVNKENEVSSRLHLITSKFLSEILAWEISFVGSL